MSAYTRDWKLSHCDPFGRCLRTETFTSGRNEAEERTRRSDSDVAKLYEVTETGEQLRLEIGLEVQS